MPQDRGIRPISSPSGRTDFQRLGQLIQDRTNDMRAVIKLLLQDQRGIAASAGANADAPAARNSLWRRLSNLSLGLPPHLHHLSPPALQHLKIQEYADETGLRRFRRLFIDVDVKKLESSLLPFLVAHLAHIRSGCFHHPPVYFRSASKLAFLLCSNRAGSRVSYLSIAIIQRDHRACSVSPSL